MSKYMLLKKMNFILDNIGINPVKTIKFIAGMSFVIKDYIKLKKQKGNDKTFRFGKFVPITFDKFDEAGIMRGQYFHQDLYVAKLIYRNNPAKHLDIGSRIDGFVAHIATFREIEIMDIRHQDSTVNNIKFKQADLMEMPTDMIDYTDSLSSLHAIEHFGLGRYGDPIDYMGYMKALDNMKYILKQGGKFYFSVPIGPQRIEFNAHRVFSVSYLLQIFRNDYDLISFAYINDEGNLIVNPEMATDAIDSNFGCNYGCGIFELVKR